MRVLTILALLLVAIKMGLSVAHALELPGKLRLNETTYKAVQEIYYPGFTLGGLIGEFGGMLVLAVLLYLTPYGTSRFWWTAAALMLLSVGRCDRNLPGRCACLNSWERDFDEEFRDIRLG